MSGPKRDAILARSSDSTTKKKKKKPKNEDYIGGSKGEASGGLMLRDEDEWKARDEDEDMEDGDAPVMGKDVATFQKSKSSWATVGSTSLPVTAKTEPEAGPSSPAPNTKSEPSDSVPQPQAKKRKGGLRTAAQMAEEEAARKLAEKSPSPPPDADAGDGSGAGPSRHNETVHRDASGRVIDIAKLKEEERRAEEEEKRKELERKEWTKGLVQRQARETRRQEEREMGERRNVGVSRDDVRMNREMQEVERWNDPAAEFLTRKKKKGPRRPKYEGPYAPNRFGIPPGFRWDGVDRSNGFEKKYFQAQNSAVRREYEQNQWSVEDM
nr:pre-mRNA-splicing factor CWC26 [Kwoniella dejecticola CBS 10117]OBR85879.1 pre-mRNA-splicing factor CWC26 [Kwoniella dejecticola CBS 10117]